jgi:phosphatidylserine/phosphatidylglycerophosphate/cardiolipin synthase-like enzyme
MIRFLFGDLLWKEIARKAKRARRTKAAIAYVTKASPLALKKGDVLVVDASDGAIASGQTSAAVLAALLNRGVSLKSHNGLHAKVVIGDSILFSSSANLSESSVSRLLEAGIETDNPNTVSGAVGMVEKLMEASVIVDPAFIARIKKIKVERRFGGGKSKAVATGKSHRDPVTWLLGVRTIDDPTNPEEMRRIKRGEVEAEKYIANPRSSATWIRYGRKDRVREARRGDNIVIIHRKSASADPQRVYHHAPVLLVQEEPTYTRVFYEELPNAEKKSLSWSQFKKLAKIVGLAGGLSKNAQRQLSDKASDDLNHYWEQVRGK